MKKPTILFLCLIGLLGSTMAQTIDELMQISQTQENKKEKVQYTFKGTKIINGHSIENPAAGVLQLMFSHRFSSIQNGIYDLFGLDGASIRIGFDYGIHKKIAIGIGRSTMQKAYDGYIKLKIVEQTKNGGSPLSISYISAVAVNTLRQLNVEENLAYRLYYTQQLLIAAKLAESISIQFMPTLLHRNLTASSAEPNTLFAMGIGGRYKFSKRMAFTFEYYHPFVNNAEKLNYYGALALGVDIETGGHVFQLHFTNASGMIEHQFIGMTRQSFFEGSRAIRLGFNLNRVFTLKNNPESRW